MDNSVKLFSSMPQVLESKKAPSVKKRVAMRNALGDYRTKMAAEEESLAKKLLAGTHKLAQFDTNARPSPDTRAIHRRQTSPMSPLQQPSAPHSSIVTSPATSSKSSTPSPTKPYTSSGSLQKRTHTSTAPQSNGCSSTTTPKSSESLAGSVVSDVDATKSTKSHEGSPPSQKHGVAGSQDAARTEVPFSFDFNIPPENLDSRWAQTNAAQK